MFDRFINVSVLSSDPEKYMFLISVIQEQNEGPIDQWIKNLTSDRVYSGSNLALVRTIFIFVKYARRLTKYRQRQ